MGKSKQEIIDEIRKQHESDLESLIEYLIRNIPGEYKYPERDY